ncbi:3-ketoacyl-CoA synthase 11-like [Silene latifolia]|uniref:3-ketoacyl-CoA synthase 11-like n=1 Tax=Silene latifolia TaxID=37657 RepID=UPI003D77D94A
MAEQHPIKSTLSKIKASTTYFFVVIITAFLMNNFYVHFQHLQFASKWLITTLIILALLAIILYFQTLPYPVYLLDFSCYKPENASKCSKKTLMELSRAWGTFSNESLDFQKKVLDRSGLGDETYIPGSILRVPCEPTFTEARKETEVLMYGAVDGLFAKIDINPTDIGILVLNCGVVSTTPSLSSHIVNKYKLRSNIMSYNLSGMGCSAGVISIDLAKDLLRVNKNSYALVVSVEAGSTSWHLGNDRSMLVANCVLRIGATAILLSNKRSDKRWAKYELAHTVRTHQGANDEAFDCVTVRHDSQGKVGVSLSKELIGIARNALKANLTALGPLVLPLSEKLMFFGTLVAKKVFKRYKMKSYIPNFKLAFEHFCVHAGGKGVLDGVQKNLRLTDWDMEPSRMTLYRFGNTSSTSIWYELAYAEAKGRVKKGDRIWQIAFGSGFKCNSVVWRALRNVNPAQEINPWMDEIDSFPVDVPK